MGGWSNVSCCSGNLTDKRLAPQRAQETVNPLRNLLKAHIQRLYTRLSAEGGSGSRLRNALRNTQDLLGKQLRNLLQSLLQNQRAGDPMASLMGKNLRQAHGNPQRRTPEEHLRKSMKTQGPAEETVWEPQNSDVIYPFENSYTLLLPSIRA